MAGRGGCLVTAVENPLVTGRVYIYYYSPSLTLSTYSQSPLNPEESPQHTQACSEKKQVAIVPFFHYNLV